MFVTIDRRLGDIMDIAILNWLQNFTHPILDTFFMYFTRLGDHGELWIAICLIFMAKRKTRRAGFLGLVALLIEAVLVAVVLKPLFDRPRPYVTYDFPILIPSPSGSSFPSGHTASSFAVAFVLYFNRVPLRKTIIVLAGLMSYSRLYLYVHYPSDVLFGVFTALAIAILLKIYQDRIILATKRSYYFFRDHFKGKKEKL